MGSGALRVLDEVRLAAGVVLDSERRANMEIITWVIDGDVELLVGEATHALGPGSFACVSAGSGIGCAMRNHGEVPVRVMQLWLQPTVVNAAPRCGVRQCGDAELRRGFRRIAASADADADIELRAEATVCVARGAAGEQLRYRLTAQRQAWLQVLRGGVDCGDLTAGAGDGIAIRDQDIIDLRVREDGEFLLIDLV